MESSSSEFLRSGRERRDDDEEEPPQSAPHNGNSDGPSQQLLAFEAFRTSMLDTTRLLGKDLNRHAPTYMGAFGAAIIAVVLIMQIHVVGVDYDLTPSEFIAVVIAGLVMICLGAALIALRLQTFERTEVAYGEQAKEILIQDPLVPGATLRRAMTRTPEDEPSSTPGSSAATTR